VNFNVSLIYIPGSSCLTPSFGPQLICDQGSKTFLPVSGMIQESEASPVG
jgi:hypothetical protein